MKRRHLILAVMVVAVLTAALGIASSVEVVASHELGVVLRSGRVQEVREPGVHFLTPFGIDEQILVPAARLIRAELGHSTASGERRPTLDSLMLSRDGETVTVQSTVTYRIVDPPLYLSSLRNPDRRLKVLGLAALGSAVGESPATWAAALGAEPESSEVARVEGAIRDELQEELDRYDSGLRVEGLVVHEAGVSTGDQIFADRIEESAPLHLSRGPGFGLLPVFVLREWESGLVTQFGRPVGAPVAGPGVRTRMPLVHRLHRFDRRLILHESGLSELYTRDRRGVFAHTFVLWTISEPALFYQSLRDEAGAGPRLDDLVASEAREAVAELDLGEVAARPGRARVRRKVVSGANERAAELGLEVVDIWLLLAPVER